MILTLTLLASLAVVATANQFECSADTILRFGVEKRVKELQKDCNLHEQDEQKLLCDSTADLEKAWKEFVDTADEYSKAVKSCRETVQRNKQRAGSPVRRRRAHKHDHDDGHDHHEREEGHKHRRDVDHNPNDPSVDHTGHNHRRRSVDDPNDTTIDHTGHNHKRRHVDHDPNDPNVDHTGHNHKRHHVDHDPNDPNVDHTGHNHKRRQVDHDPNDPNVDHTGHNHKRRHVDHDPNDPNVDHTGHNHKRRHVDHDPNDPNVDHTGHNHKRRHVDHDPNDPNVDRHNHGNSRSRRCTLKGYREDGQNPCNPPPIHHVSQKNADDDDRIIRERRSVEGKQSRARRGDCSVAGNEELHKLQEKYVKHCERENICLPDEDLGPNAAEDFKKLHKKHAATYAAYVRELSACYGSLKN